MGPSLPIPASLSSIAGLRIEFELEPDLSLAISANVVRLLDEEGARVRHLPRLTGGSKEAISVALGFLRKKGLIVVEATNPAAGRRSLA